MNLFPSQILAGANLGGRFTHVLRLEGPHTGDLLQNVIDPTRERIPRELPRVQKTASAHPACSDGIGIEFPHAVGKSLWSRFFKESLDAVLNAFGRPAAINRDNRLTECHGF